MDELDQALQKINDEFEKERDANRARVESEIRGEQQASEEWPRLIERFRSLNGKPLGWSNCSWIEPNIFQYGDFTAKFGIYAKEAVISLGDKMVRPFESINALPKQDEAGSFHWFAAVEKKERVELTTPGLAALIIERLENARKRAEHSRNGQR